MKIKVSKTTLKNLVKTTQEKNTYETNAITNVYPSLKKEEKNEIEFETQYNTIVKFKIDIDQRQWGINYISIYPISIEPIQFKILDPDTLETIKTITVNIEPEKINKKSEKANVTTVKEMEIYIDAQGNVDYDLSTIYFYSH